MNQPNINFKSLSSVCRNCTPETMIKNMDALFQKHIKKHPKETFYPIVTKYSADPILTLVKRRMPVEVIHHLVQYHKLSNLPFQRLASALGDIKQLDPNVLRCFLDYGLSPHTLLEGNNEFSYKGTMLTKFFTNEPCLFVLLEYGASLEHTLSSYPNMARQMSDHLIDVHRRFTAAHAAKQNEGTEEAAKPTPARGPRL